MEKSFEIAKILNLYQVIADEFFYLLALIE